MIEEERDGEREGLRRREKVRARGTRIERGER